MVRAAGLRNLQIGSHSAHHLACVEQGTETEVQTEMNDATMTTLSRTMFLEIGHKRFQVASFEDDKAGEGASNTPSPKIVDERGEVIGHVSYNGRIWAGPAYATGAVPLYDNQ
jgi:hypothetical protein